MTEPMTEQEWIDIREFGSHAFYPVAGGRYVKLIAEVERLREEVKSLKQEAVWAEFDHNEANET